MTRVFESIGTPIQRDHIKEIVSTVRFFGFITRQDLWVRSMNQMTHREFLEAVTAAVQAGLVEVVFSKKGTMGFAVPQKGKLSA